MALVCREDGARVWATVFLRSTPPPRRIEVIAVFHGAQLAGCLWVEVGPHVQRNLISPEAPAKKKNTRETGNCTHAETEAWRMRSGAILACATARAIVASLLKLSSAQGADRSRPPTRATGMFGLLRFCADRCAHDEVSTSCPKKNAVVFTALPPAGCVRVTCSRFVSRSLRHSRPSTLGLVALATVAVSSTSLAGVHPGWGAWEAGLCAWKQETVSRQKNVMAHDLYVTESNVREADGFVRLFSSRSTQVSCVFVHTEVEQRQVWSHCAVRQRKELRVVWGEEDVRRLWFSGPRWSDEMAQLIAVCSCTDKRPHASGMVQTMGSILTCACARVQCSCLSKVPGTRSDPPSDF